MTHFSSIFVYGALMLPLVLVAETGRASDLRSLSAELSIPTAARVEVRSDELNASDTTGRVDVISCGDFNEDGGITATDALGTLNAAVGSAQCLVCVCDVDMSGTISATDALATLQFAVGLPVTLACQADGNPVAWDGGGDGVSWTDPLNWDTETRIPNGCDDVTIAAGPAVTVTHDSGDNRVLRLVSDLPLSLNGGSLTLRDTIQVNDTLLLNGGTLANGTLLASAAPAMDAGIGVNATASAGIVVATDERSTLQNMTVNAPINLPDINAVIDVRNGLTLNSTATFGGLASGFRFIGVPQTLDGTGEVVIEAGHPGGAISQATGSHLTIGEDFFVHGTFGSVGTNAGSLTFTNDGTIDSDMPGEIQIHGFGGLTNNGTLRVSGGDMFVRHAWTNNGTIVAGAGHKLRVLFGADLTQLSPTSVVQVDITGSTQFGLVSIDDAVALDGTLAINTMTNGTPLDIGDSMVIMTYASKTGTFSAITGTDIGAGKEFAVDIGATEVRLTVVVAGM